MWKTHIFMCKTHLLYKTSLNYLFMKMFVGSDLKRVNETSENSVRKLVRVRKTNKMCAKTDESV